MFFGSKNDLSIYIYIALLVFVYMWVCVSHFACPHIHRIFVRVKKDQKHEAPNIYFTTEFIPIIKPISASQIEIYQKEEIPEKIS